MIKNIFLSLTLLFSVLICAQDGTSSPYSFYGIGDMKFKGSIDNRSMGSIGVFPDSIHLNLQNPASLTSLKYISFTIGGNYRTTEYKTNAQKEVAKRSALDYIALGIPVGKFATAFGLMPVSAVGYQIQNINQTEISRQFSGKGGVNRAFVGFAYKINKNLSAGLDLNFNFGQITTNNIVFQNNVQYGSRELNISNINGFNTNFGLMYDRKLNKKLHFYSSLVLAPEAKLISRNTRNIAIVQFTPGVGELVLSGSEVTPNVANKTIKLPSKFSFGVGVGELKKWALGTEITLYQSASYSNRFVDITNGSYQNGSVFSLGGYFIPKYNSFNSYFERVTFRAGLRHEVTGLVINNKSITDTAITSGIGLPVGAMLSNINLGFEFGKRGTKAAGLVQENYFNLLISLSLTDKWFQKRKYD